MAIRITGNGFAKISQWRKKFGPSAVEQVKRAVMKNIAEEALELVQEGFEKEQAPSGRAWARLKSRSGRILQDTGRLRSSFHRKNVSSVSVTIGPGVSYATFHQSGTKRMVARPMVPEGSLPAKWKIRINRVAQEVMADAFGG